MPKKTKIDQPDKKSFLSKLGLCLSACLCWMSNQVEPSEDYLEPTKDKEKKDLEFWNCFYKAYSALSTPVIVGKIEANTPDVTIVYANKAATDFTGYQQTKYDKEYKPLGLIGRDVTTLMTPEDKRAHRGYVSRWLAAHGRTVTVERSTTSSESDSYEAPKEIGSIALGENNTRSGNIEGVARSVTLVTSQGNYRKANASLTFFASRKQVVGIFSFSELPLVPCLQFNDVTIQMTYNPRSPSQQGTFNSFAINEEDKESQPVTTPPNNPITIYITPPPNLAEFVEEKKWDFKCVGGEIDDKTKKQIRGIVFNAITNKLNQAALGSKMNLTLIEGNEQPLSGETMQKVRHLIFQAINDEANDKNMNMSISVKLRKEENRLLRFAKIGEGCPLGQDESTPFQGSQLQYSAMSQIKI